MRLTPQIECYRLSDRARALLGNPPYGVELRVRRVVRDYMAKHAPELIFCACTCRGHELVVYVDEPEGRPVAMIDELVWAQEQITEGEFAGKMMQLPDVLIGRIKPPGVTVN